MLRSYESLRPGTNKLIRHPEHLMKIRDGVPTAPLHVSIWPTVRCQMSCAYCCCRSEDRKGPDLTWQNFVEAVDVLSSLGTKALEFAGGGEPLLWPQFSEGVLYAKNKGLKTSLITNGLELGSLDPMILKSIDWLRVSVQSVAHARSVKIDEALKYTRVSFSVIFDPSIDFRELHTFIAKRNIPTRIAAPQPSDPWAEDALKMIERHYGAPFFFAEKPKGSPAGCYMAWIRAAIDWRGWFLPCPSVMLVDDSGKISENFKICEVKDLREFLTKTEPQDLGYRCAFCNCGKDNNDFAHVLVEGIDDEDFV